MTSPVFDAYWRFAAERQRIYFARLDGLAGPWTTDPILAQFRFTNVYRASDRVSQYLITKVIYDGIDREPVDVILRVLLFKIFNLPATWEWLNTKLGPITAGTFDPCKVSQALDEAMALGKTVYSAAYIVPPIPGGAGRRKHSGHSELLADLVEGGGLAELSKATSLEDLYVQLESIPGFGAFLAYQFAIDLNYSDAFAFDENEFVVAGPGAIDGLVKCFGVSVARRPAEQIASVWAEQEAELEVRGLEFQNLWGRRMSLIDIQNLFCEVSKYSRVSHPDVPGISGRTRIKRSFAPSGAVDPPRFPPKWGLQVDQFGA